MSNLVSIKPELYAHSSGALWIPVLSTAVIADLHLGFSWAQRRRGELGPLADARTREKVLRLTDELQPARVVFLGDLVHAPKPCEPERFWIANLLRDLAARAELIAVRGNHDRAFAREFTDVPVRTVDCWSQASYLAFHGDRLPLRTDPSRTLIVGHLHPALPVIDAAGAGQKVPVFLVTNQCLVLPAFSPFAGGYDLLCGIPAELNVLLPYEDVHAYAATRSRVVALGPLKRAIERMLESDLGSAKQFRRRG